MSLSQGLQKLRVAVLSTLLGARTEKVQTLSKDTFQKSNKPVADQTEINLQQ